MKCINPYLKRFFFGRELNIVDMTKAEFEERKQKKDPFTGDIFSKSIIRIL